MQDFKIFAGNISLLVKINLAKLEILSISGLLNIIDKACKYTDKGGMEIDIQDEGKYQIVIIKDTGIGIAKNEQKRLFEKFTRGRKAIETNVQGFSLGLFIAKKIVDGHHGKIELESEGYGNGTTVKIYLPEG